MELSFIVKENIIFIASIVDISAEENQ